MIHTGQLPLHILGGLLRDVQERATEEREVEKVAVEVLKDEWKRGFAAVLAPASLAHRTSRRIKEKRAVIGFAVIVAGSAKPEWAAEN